jgi:hypothetical protein
MKSELLKKLESVPVNTIIGLAVKSALRRGLLEEAIAELKEAHILNSKMIDEALGFELLKFCA